jgi:hypothetical protein
MLLQERDALQPAASPPARTRRLTVGFLVQILVAWFETNDARCGYG